MTSQKTIQDLRNAGIPIYDTSTIKSFLWCPRGAFHRHIQGIVPKEQKPNPGMHFGTAIHLALETWFGKEFYKDDQKAILVFVESFREHEEIPKLGAKGQPLKTTYSTIFGCSLLQTYFHKYRNDDREILGLEYPIAEEIMDNVYLVGKIDKIVQAKSGKKFVDYKTTKYDFLTNPNPQMCGYKFLLEKLLGEKVEGEVDIFRISKSKPPEELLSRVPIDYSSYHMQEWKKSIVQNIKNIERFKKKNEYPQAWDCKPFFRDCAYMPLCTAASEDIKQKLIEEKYIIELWDPLHQED
jgi:CRISPR/Cas system-associated exonuclease Cas4 (RecB family)